MSYEPDVLVIGGGAIGVCSAYYLSKNGASVSIVEMNEVASGCTKANAGLIVPSYIIPLANPGAIRQGLRWMLKPDSPFYIRPRLNWGLLCWLFRFWRASSKEKMEKGIRALGDLNGACSGMFEELARNESLECEYTSAGWLFVYRTEKAFKKSCKEAQFLKSYGIEAKILSPEETLEIEPALLHRVTGGVYYNETAHLDPAIFVGSLADRLRSTGVEIHEQTHVIAFETQRGVIKSVRTNKRAFQPKETVIAGGCWSPRIAGLLNARLLIQPAKGYSITLDKPASCPKIPLYLGESKVAATPFKKTLRLSGTLEMTGMDFRINKRRIEALKSAAKEYLGPVEGLDTGELWAGLRPCTPDGLPIISRFPEYENCIIATGHGMLGITLAPITGRLVSQLFYKKPPEIDISPFSVNRFY